MTLDKAGYDGHVLRFLAKLQHTGPDPTGLAEQRRFIICYFLADGTVSVFEQSTKNVGMYPTVSRVFDEIRRMCEFAFLRAINIISESN